MKSALVLISLLVAGFAGVACAPEPAERQVAISKPQRSTPDSVESMWHSHEVVIQAALDGGPVFEDRYMEACKFFEELTGIPVRGEGTFVGWMPNEHTAEDLRAIHEWYSINRDRLYWDDGTKSIKIRE